jgi:hypothetical protein
MPVTTRNTVAAANMASWWMVYFLKPLLFVESGVIVDFLAFGTGTTVFWMVKRILDAW